MIEEWDSVSTIEKQEMHRDINETILHNVSMYLLLIVYDLK